MARPWKPGDAALYRGADAAWPVIIVAPAAGKRDAFWVKPIRESGKLGEQIIAHGDSLELLPDPVPRLMAEQHRLRELRDQLYTALGDAEAELLTVERALHILQPGEETE